MLHCGHRDVETLVSAANGLCFYIITLLVCTCTYVYIYVCISVKPSETVAVEALKSGFRSVVIKSLKPAFCSLYETLHCICSRLVTVPSHFGRFWNFKLGLEITGK